MTDSLPPASRAPFADAAIALYAGLGRLGARAVTRYLARRRAAGKEHSVRWPERLGEPGLARPDGPLVWLHGASVGEALSTLPLLHWLQRTRPDLTLLLTSGTVASAALLAERLPEGVLHQFVPVDLPAAVDGFLDHWRPDLAIWIESELWPTLITRTARRGTPLLLVNGRLSPGSFRRWRLAGPLIRRLLGRFALLLAQSPGDAERLEALGGRPAGCVGNLKLAADPLPCTPPMLAALEAQRAGRPLWLAASTHPGEEAIVAEAHARLVERHPGLVTVIVPRHPARGAEIRSALAQAGAPAALRSTGADLPLEAGLYIADTIGELGCWYRLAAVAFIGGSLVPHGGQNPIEAARLGCPVLHGPSFGNFAVLASDLRAAGAARELENAAALVPAVDALLSDPARRAAMAAAGRCYAEGQRDALDRITAEIAPFLPPVRAAAIPA